MPQTLRTQNCPVGQAVPQAPQLLRSEVRLAQAVPHAVWPAAQVHAPAMQVWVAVQTLPQAPQLFRSVATVAQVEPHRCCPVEQGAAHTPAAQRRLPAHARPHIPQLLLSERTSVQTGPQRTLGAGQNGSVERTAVQTPATQA